MAGRFGKKSQVVDLIYFIGLVFLIGVIGIISMYVVSQSRQQFDTDDTLRASNIQIVKDYEDRLPGMLDQLFILTLIGIGIVTLVSALFVVSHPIFYGLMLIIMAFMTWFSAIYANVYQEFAANPDWSTYADQLVMVTYIMKWYPMITIVLSVIIVLVMVAKRD